MFWWDVCNRLLNVSVCGAHSLSIESNDTTCEARYISLYTHIVSSSVANPLMHTFIDVLFMIKIYELISFHPLVYGHELIYA